MDRTPRKTQSTKLTPSITAAGKLAGMWIADWPHHRGLAVLLTFSRLTLSKANRVRPSILRLRVRAANARTVVEKIRSPRATADRYRTACGSKRVNNSIFAETNLVLLVPEVEHMTRLLPQAVPYLSPASRVKLLWVISSWGLRPRLYAFACSAG